MQVTPEPIHTAPLDLLLITLDQCRGDMLGAGRRLVPTPNLDALAKAGTRFDRHYVQAYPCGPARACLVTGLYAHKHRSIGNGVPLDARHPTLFTELRRAGYLPTLFGYTDTTPDPRGLAPGDPDLGEYEGVCAGLAVDTLLTERSTPWLAHLKARGYPVPDPDRGRDGIFAQRRFGEPAVFAAEDSEAAFLTDRFLAWLSVTGQSPLCAHISYVAPHPPFAVAAPLHDLIDPADMPAPVRGASIDVERAQHPLVGAILDGTDLRSFAPGLSGSPASADRDLIGRIKATYAAMLYDVDAQVGRIVQALKDAGRWERTLVVVTGDHGEQLFDHWLLGKTAYFDQSAHIPLIIRDPRGSADGGRGTAVSAFTETVDLMPTLLDAVGIRTPRNCDGRSLLPFCTGATPSGWRDEVHWSFDFRDIRTRRLETLFGLPSDWCNLQVVRTERLKYVHFAGLPPVLFDLNEDPDELVNRAANPSLGELRMEGLDRMLSWRQRTEDRELTGYLARRGVLTRDDA